MHDSTQSVIDGAGEHTRQAFRVIGIHVGESYTLKTGISVEDVDSILKLLRRVSCPEIQLRVAIHSELDFIYGDLGKYPGICGRRPTYTILEILVAGSSCILT